MSRRGLSSLALAGAVALAGALAGALACAGPESTSPYRSQGSPATRDEPRAAALVDAAAKRMPGDPAGAEKLLREALAADLFHAKAHNNLGVLLLAQGDLYAAAQEFEWARKLLPGHPEPRLNLALTLERAGQAREAEAAYTSALEVYPGYMPAIQGLARLTASEHPPRPELDDWLRAIALGGESEAWRTWARARAAGSPAPR